MTDFSEVLLRGGPVALIIAAAIALKYAVEGVIAWRSSRRGEPGADVPTDAATTNAMLLNSLRSVQDEGLRKDRRIDELEAEVDQLRTENFEQRRSYETEIANLRRQLTNFTLQLDELQARIRAGRTEH